MSASLGIEKSPINVLLELCTAQHFPSPAFTLSDIDGPGKPVFMFTCTLLNHQVKGFGSKKKLAKRDAAVKMLEVVNSEK
jgi:dsRNA-specific ribonuclease